MSFIFKLLLLAVVGVVLVRAAGRNSDSEHLSSSMGNSGSAGELHEEHSGEGYQKKDASRSQVAEKRPEKEPAKESTVVINQPTIIKEDKKDDLFGLNGMGQWIKYIFNPCELIKKISEHFKLDSRKLLERMDDRLVKGPEVVFEPLVVSFRIMERLFQNDICRRRFFCQIGIYFKPLSEPFAKFSSKIPTISNQLREINQSIFDKDCERDFPECTPFLKKPFSSLKDDKEV